MCVCFHSNNSGLYVDVAAAYSTQLSRSANLPPPGDITATNPNSLHLYHVFTETFQTAYVYFELSHNQGLFIQIYWMNCTSHS